MVPRKHPVTPALKGKPKAYSYLRFSTPEQLKGDSMRRQAEMAVRYAAVNGFDLDESLTFRDLGLSAFHGRNASIGALSAFLEAVKAGDIQPGAVLLVEALDRISRMEARKAVRILEDIIDSGVDVVTLVDGKRYTLESIKGFDFLMAVILLFRGNEESQMKSRRLKSVWAAKRGRLGDGKAMTATTPGWIKLDAQRRAVFIPERARIVKQMVSWALQGMGKELMARRLNEQDVKSFRKGGHWRASQVRKVLVNPALMGTFIPHTNEHKEGKRIRTPLDPVPDYFPSVIDSDSYQRLQSIVDKSPLRGRHATGAVRNILSGLARCAFCGGTMIRTSKGPKSQPRLVCSKAKSGAGCEYRSVLMGDIESALTDRAKEIANAAPAPDAAAMRALQDAETTLDVLEERLSDMLNLLERAPSEALAHRVAALEGEVKAARVTRDAADEAARQAETRLNTIKTGALGGALAAKPVDVAKANAALRALLREVVVDPGHGTMALRWHLGGEYSVAFAFPETKG